MLKDSEKYTTVLHLFWGKSSMVLYVIYDNCFVYLFHNLCKKTQTGQYADLVASPMISFQNLLLLWQV